MQARVMLFKENIEFKFYWNKCRCHTLSVYILRVKGKNKLGGVRKINFGVGMKFSIALYTENKVPQAFPGNRE